MCFQHSVQRRGNTFCVFTQVAQIVHHKTQLRFIGIYILDPGDPFDGFGLKDITTQSIDRICGVDDHAPIHQTFDDGFDMTWVRIIRMNGEEHAAIYELLAGVL